MTAANRLHPCAVCARHVRARESVCPFCGASIDPSLAARSAPLPPAARLSRAALFALGAGTLSLTNACGGQVSDPETRDTGAEAAPSPAAEAGSSPAAEAGEASIGVGTIAPPYGLAPPPFDAGIEGVDASEGEAQAADGSEVADANAAAAAFDAEVDAHAMVLPPYGKPPR
jgi:hypothetical protein